MVQPLLPIPPPPPCGVAGLRGKGWVGCSRCPRTVVARLRSTPPKGSAHVSTSTAIVVIGAVAIVGFYLLAGYVVYKTGGTDGIADIGRAVADIISALTRRS